MWWQFILTFGVIILLVIVIVGLVIIFVVPKNKHDDFECPCKKKVKGNGK